MKDSAVDNSIKETKLKKEFFLFRQSFYSVYLLRKKENFIKT